MREDVIMPIYRWEYKQNLKIKVSTKNNSNITVIEEILTFYILILGQVSIPFCLKTKKTLE